MVTLRSTMRWPQLVHAQPSTSKTRCRSQAQGSQRRRASFERRSGRQSLSSSSETDSRAGLWARATTRARKRERAARTPRYTTRLDCGGGTSAARRLTSSYGVKSEVRTFEWSRGCQHKERIVDTPMVSCRRVSNQEPLDQQPGRGASEQIGATRARLPLELPRLPAQREQPWRLLQAHPPCRTTP